VFLFHFKKIKNNISQCIAIFSDNDKFVPVDNQEDIHKKFNARIVVEHKKGHFGINTYFYDNDKKDLESLKKFLDKNI
jgi:predicted alpha/beta hydrolase family esterase